VLHAFDLTERKDKTVLSGIARWLLSHDGSKILYQAKASPGTFGIIDAKPDAGARIGEGTLNLSGLRLDVDPPAEWRQIFNEVWRQERDYFFEASMNGVDWEAVRKKYEALLPHVASRYDLTYILGEMVGELSNSHTYVNSPADSGLHPVAEGLLGTDYELDAASGYYRFKKIYPGENWDAESRSPLTEPGLNVKAGDYLLAVNGRPSRPTNCWRTPPTRPPRLPSMPRLRSTGRAPSPSSLSPTNSNYA
jgi:tricorn protease